MSSSRDEWETTKAAFKNVYKLLRKPDSDDEEEEGKIEEKDNAPFTTLSIQHHYSSRLEPRSIRLVTLESGRGADVITCSLQTYHLKTLDEQYEALSYVWGSSVATKHIIVDNGSFAITPNLHTALHNLRYPDRSRRLWVDAICINQSLQEERNDQGPLMCEIYRNATCTICFFGPKQSTTKALFAMLEDLARDAQNLAHKKSPASSTERLSSFTSHVSISPTESQLREQYRGDPSIMAMAACTWWHRAWTCQELLLSDNAKFMIGRYSMSWKTICEAVDHGLNIEIWSPVQLGFYVDRAVVPYLSMRALMRRREIQRASSGLIPDQPTTEPPASELLHLLEHCRYRSSTDPRDKVYAVLGILRNAYPDILMESHKDNLNIKLDYSHPVIYVYRKITETLITKLKNLDVLGSCTASSRRGLPSWVIDWSITERVASSFSRDSLDQQRKTHATKHSTAEVIFPNDCVSMILQGHQLSEIEEVTLVLPTLDDYASREEQAYYVPERKFDLSRTVRGIHTTLRDSMLVYEAIFSWSRFSSAKAPTNTLESSEDTFWQTLCAGTYSTEGVAATATLFNEWFDALRSVGEFIEKHPHTHEKIPEIAFGKLKYNTWDTYGQFWSYAAAAQHRRMGRATNGWLCLLPKDTQKGDLIILAKGGRVPLIARLNDDGYHTFVGEAYIHGIMDGEAFDAEKCEPISFC